MLLHATGRHVNINLLSPAGMFVFSLVHSQGCASFSAGVVPANSV